MKTPSPARVHILLAREASTAIVIRRGPAKQVCTLLWNRKNDTFTLGQWLKGRIYERRADLSPDGKHLIYFALGGGRGGKHYAWTAVSRTPYLKAIGFWPTNGTWGGGGHFLSNRTYWLNPVFHMEKDASIVLPNSLREMAPPFEDGLGCECPGIYYPRLQRDGWMRVKRVKNADDAITLFDKPLPKGWVLRKRAHATAQERPLGKGCYYDTHQLRHPERGEALDFPDWEWADWDANRLVWVERGVLFAARLSAKGPGFIRQLYDFNSLKFEAIPAPY